ITDFAHWLRDTQGVQTETYDELWRYSVTDLDGFWKAIWEYFCVRGSGGEGAMAAEATPGAAWFPSASLNYAEHVFAERSDSDLAIVHASELRPTKTVTIGELKREVSAVAAGLRDSGIGPGD